MIQFAAYTIIGLSLGGIFALAALGIVLIYRVTGVLLALQSAASLIWKNNQYHLPIYLAPQTSTFKIADVPIGANYIVIVVVALGLAFGLAAFLRSTAFGRAMRAVSDDPTAASLWGVRVDMVGAVSWMLGSLIAAVAGILI